MRIDVASCAVCGGSPSWECVVRGGVRRACDDHLGQVLRDGNDDTYAVHRIKIPEGEAELRFSDGRVIRITNIGSAPDTGAVRP